MPKATSSGASYINEDGNLVTVDVTGVPISVTDEGVVPAADEDDMPESAQDGADTEDHEQAMGSAGIEQVDAPVKPEPDDVSADESVEELQARLAAAQARQAQQEPDAAQESPATPEPDAPKE